MANKKDIKTIKGLNQMAVMEVIKYGHPTLRKVAEPFTAEEIEQDFIEDMIETMHEEDGVGLAAPQVNVSKRIVVASDLENVFVLINPVIVATSERTQTETEGCLSLPGLQAEVNRPIKVIVKALDRHGEPFELKAEGLLARVLQHEIDHLNGVLFIDKANLDTLVWLIENEKEEVEKKKTDIISVQEEFRKRYFAGAESLVFEVKSEIVRQK